jgi:hypothetical protein
MDILVAGYAVSAAFLRSLSSKFDHVLCAKVGQNGYKRVQFGLFWKCTRSSSIPLRS